MPEADRAKLEAMSTQLAEVRGRVAALERIARKAQKSAECAKVMALVAAVIVVAVAVIVAVVLFGDCPATGC